MILLSDCVGMVESSGNHCAMRYEPDFIPNQNAIQSTQARATGGYMDQITARMIASTSWGEFQIMGANLYGVLNYKKTILDYLSDASDQLSTFNEFIEHIGFTDVPFNLISENALLKFAKLYNGSELYAQSLQAAYNNMMAKS